jgi:hypothetical protein
VSTSRELARASFLDIAWARTAFSAIISSTVKSLEIVMKVGGVRDFDGCSDEFGEVIS